MEKDWKADKIIREQEVEQEDAEIFEEWCFERYDNESDITEDAYEQFCEEGQGNDPDYVY